MRSKKRYRFLGLLVGITALGLHGCWPLQSGDPGKPRSVYFIGVDVSGSFMKSRYYEDSLDFLSYYLYAHLKGLGGLEVPKSLFIGSLGGVALREDKTFFPIQEFQDKSIEEIRTTLNKLFPRGKTNPLTDFNAFFEHVETTVRNKNLILKPINILLLSDGVPDFSGNRGSHNVRRLKVENMELLSRNVTLRLLYTDAVTGASWQDKIKRQRIKIWTQDAAVMDAWKDPKILLPNTPFEQQTKFFDWVKDNVDFGVRAKRVD